MLNLIQQSWQPYLVTKNNISYYKQQGNNLSFFIQGKVTPKKQGYFVTLYKKINNINVPFNIADNITNIIIQTTNNYLYFNTKQILELQLLTSSNNKGKMGFRVYNMQPSNISAIKVYNICKPCIVTKQQLISILHNSNLL